MGQKKSFPWCCFASSFWNTFLSADRYSVEVLLVLRTLSFLPKAWGFLSTKFVALWKILSTDNIPYGNLLCWHKWQVSYIPTPDSVVTIPFYLLQVLQPSHTILQHLLCRKGVTDLEDWAAVTLQSARGSQPCPRKPQARGNCIQKTAVIILCSFLLIHLSYMQFFLSFVS